MTLQEALTILTTFQLWRISDDEVHIQKPSEVTNALDVLLNHCVGTLELPQQERLYSEEDMDNYAEYCVEHTLTKQIGHPYMSVKDWFEQFKKK
jgi:hypothetical protein